ncbi:MAG TPA: amidase [Stellaceae bacterium]|nr:amidase [Stellaceae bacterium]
MTEFLTHPLPALAQALYQRQISARDLVEEAIANHERCDALTNAYLLWTSSRARKGAAAADAAFAAGAIAGPLQGIPISIKDLFAAEGLPTFAGSDRRLPPEWEVDGPVVAALRRQLGVIMGKTHMVEFAFGGTGQNCHWGAPRNPWDKTAHRSPGGSSSGAGVSLMEGSALLALGSDTAGSVRIPAAMTGTVGLKLTLGRWSAAGVVPLSPTFDTPGLLTRTVEDAAFGFGSIDAMVGDPFHYLSRISTLEIAGVRIGMGDPFLWSDCDPGIAEGAKAAVDALAAKGALVRERALPEARAAYDVFLEGGFSAIELRSFLDQELPQWLPELDPIMAPAVKNAETLTAREYLARLQRVRSLSRTAQERFADVEVFVSPTVCATPALISEVRDTGGHLRVNRRLVHNTVGVNYLGLCAITLPVALDRAGMPVGLQFIAPPGNEERLIAVALAAEHALGTGRQRLGAPPLLAL